MGKRVFKQIIVISLTIITVCLAFAIILYKYIPTNKVIPAKVTEYSTPESVEAEIKESTTEQEFSSKNETYEITDSDLSLFQSNKSYNPGKSDPFKEYKEETDNVTSSGKQPSGKQAKNSETNAEDKNTTDNYYKASGIGTGSK